MKNNKQIKKAKKNKRDEFYTKYETVQDELIHYADSLKGKVVFCNCDNPEWSNFWKYLKDRFQELQLKRLISTYYSNKEKPVKTELYQQDNELVQEQSRLKGNGDFRSQECLDILKDADVVITNPPFSLAKEFIPLMYEYEKQFLILGNQNAVTFREVYPHLLDSTFFFGVTIHSGDVEFEIPSKYRLIGNAREEDGKQYARVTGIRWLTNIPHHNEVKNLKLQTAEWNLKNHHKLIEKLTKSYGMQKYPKYDNYPSAIEVPITETIPSDYTGVMGVPITFFDKFNPAQFRIIGCRKGLDGKDLSINGKPLYFRLLIQRKGAIA